MWGSANGLVWDVHGRWATDTGAVVRWRTCGGLGERERWGVRINGQSL
jgi:hypothetical protein